MGYVKRQLTEIISRRKKYKSIGVPIRELLRLRSAPYHLDTKTILYGKPIRINSPYWYLHGLREIFFEESYHFNSLRQQPVIIDCGANIGLSIIFFKKCFPDSKITGFEPDPEIFTMLEHNISSFKFQDVELYQKAVWVSNGTISFSTDEGVGGSILNASRHDRVVRTIRLRELLENRKVDFLKLDIEGAEYEVLKDCKDLLPNIESIFVEFHASSNSEQKLDEVISILKESGFRVYIKEAWPIFEKPFLDRPQHAFDMQLNIFAYKKENGKSNTE